MSVILIILTLVLGLICGLIVLLMMLGGIGALLRLGAGPSFEMLAVDGDRRLHYVCEGPETAPLVLYDAGAFGIYTDGWWVMKELSRDHRVCLYDRAGMGWSDPLAKDVEAGPDFHVEDMRRLRAALGYDKPFVLVGHSMAGIRLHAYANAYPEELSGLVFVDAARPQNIEASRVESFVPWMSRALSVSGFFARIGLAGGASLFLPDELNLSGAPARDKRRSVAAVSHHKATKRELLDAVATWPGASWADQTQAENLPVFVFSNSANGGANASVAAQAEANTGLGGITALPDETHVSLLNEANAKRIAADVRKITDGTRND